MPGQDVVVQVTLDTRIPPRETLLPLLLSDEGEKPYAEYASLDALMADYPNTTKTYACAKDLFGQSELAPGRITKCAVVGVDAAATDAAVIDALNELRTQQDDWYFLIPVEATDARIQALAAWAATTLLSVVDLREGVVESEKLLVAQTTNKALACTEPLSVICYNPKDGYEHAAWVGRTAPYYPNAVTWKWKELAGIKPCGLSGTALRAVLANKLNAYMTSNKRNYMSEGVCCDGEFIDTVISRRQIKDMLRTAVTNYLVDHPVVPYDNEGFTQLGSVVIEVLNQAVGYSLILSGFQVTIPKREEATREQEAQRVMPPIAWRATQRGGVHGVEISGVLSVSLTN